MSKNIINQSTLDVIDQITLSLSRQYDWRDWMNTDQWKSNSTPNLTSIRRRLEYLEEILRQSDHTKQILTNEESSSTNWLYYDEVQEVIPIYNEAIAIAATRLIVAPSLVPKLLAFMGISGTNTGIDVENHEGKGYHFHYGKVKRDALERYNVLLTFNKSDVDQHKNPISNIPLHVEPHASGKCVHIDASTIGHNRRLPIYLVCLNAIKSRGLENFLMPSKTSFKFYP